MARLGTSVVLRGWGSTNLPDGAKVTIVIATTSTLQTFECRCVGGRFQLEVPAAGEVTNGTYRVLVRFRIEEQEPALRDSLSWQPRKLETSATLAIGNALSPEAALRPALAALVDATNRARTLDEVRSLALQVETLERRLWLSTLLPGVRRLRTGLAEAQKNTSNIDYSRLQRDAVEAQVLAGL